MYDSIQDITQIEIERHMNDSASRAQVATLGQQRVVSMQKLLLKVQSMSDKDFETAFTSIESVIDALTQKKINHKDKDSSTQNKQLAGLLAPKA